MIVAPATADLLSRAATGRADDLLTSALLTARCPVVMAPAMHTEMWEHAATRANVATLRERGVHVVEPASGRLTGADTGPGRLPEPEQIAEIALAVAGRAEQGGTSGTARDLDGRHVVVSAGGTREPIDPVRFLGNRSSGLQGVEIARAARKRGARVTLVAASVGVDVSDLDPGSLVEVETTAELRSAVRSAGGDADVIVMAAAVADFRPAGTAASKIKKSAGAPPPTIELVENPDILAELSAERLRPGQVVVGFAAETGDADGDVLEHGRAKARRKGADLLAINAVGDGVGFGVAENAVTIVDRDGETVSTGQGTKRAVAEALLDAVVSRLAR
ncbi:phosphopantothenoylcysteine decarboxylase [Paraoerskovia sediminicola]|uniref:Coenzyme A biosynthesis bifunctional protein CoaBC n=1 Tax=Paraoerskovia sediminicola TaxID=1138587 RepID=A0ABM8G6C1_9CELL|nr:phosphopantothenoylcysteine decarboxylase [Paraoerskovia sediminicola]